MKTNLATVFAVSITMQFLAVVLHDWVNIPGWTHGHQVQEVIGRTKLLAATAVNAIFPGVAVALVWPYFHTAKPRLIPAYWVIYCLITVISAVYMWYMPYWFGADNRTREQYSRMYAGTRQILPARGDNPRPNLLHIYFHLLFVLNFGLALGLLFRTTG